MRILVTGAGGLLGTDVCRAAESADVEVVGWSRSELDVTDGQTVAQKLRRLAPAVVVNCAAWTDVDRAEVDEQRATAVNGAGAGNVARAAAATDAWTVHMSSDYVFDGAKSTPYLESDRPAPRSAYGRSKLAGERAVQRAAPDAHTVVRTSWLFGNGGRCFPRTILRLASERDVLTVVDDQVGCPTFTGHLAPVLIELATTARLRGTIHLSGGGECSWCEFAQAVIDAARLDAQIKPGRTEDMERPAPRPRYSALRSERPEVPALPQWREGVIEFFAAGVRAR
ncbi:MAG TPA: dTDP-4-dehydrorhamnose reductase [Solirubrobacteraceae bacterium]|nr:dTDP-4-dehydrorhamnose reductase [Solirubrobacteraceae bacterium]